MLVHCRHSIIPFHLPAQPSRSVCVSMLTADKFCVGVTCIVHISTCLAKYHARHPVYLTSIEEADANTRGLLPSQDISPLSTRYPSHIHVVQAAALGLRPRFKAHMCFTLSVDLPVLPRAHTRSTCLNVADLLRVTSSPYRSSLSFVLSWSKSGALDQ